MTHQKSTPFPLPWSDWIKIVTTTILYPSLMILVFIAAAQWIEPLTFITLLTIVAGVTALAVAKVFIDTSSELKLYVEEVGYYHFNPSNKDLLLFLITQVFYLALVGLGLIFILQSWLQSRSEDQLSTYIAIALVLSLFLQIGIVVASMLSKRKLVATAQEELPEDVVKHVRQHHPNSHLIHEYRFADIKPASLFLSAGVTTLSFRRNICLVSRYFQWNLTKDELIAVLSHEEGHLLTRDVTKNYLIMGTEGWMRAIRFFGIIGLLALYLYAPERDLAVLVALALLLLLLFLSSGMLRLIQQHRMLLQEIRADKYGSSLVGNEMLAHTLQKLPSVIPAPVNSNPLDFLGFRIALLRKRARDLGEEPIVHRQTSRFSTN